MSILFVVEIMAQERLFHISGWASESRARRAATSALLQLRDENRGVPISYTLTFRSEDLDR